MSYNAPPPAAAPQHPPTALAHWGQRVGAYLIDSALSILGAVISWIAVIQYTSSLASNPTAYDPNSPTPAEMPSLGPLYYIGLLISLLGLGFLIWSYLIKQAKDGQSFGKEKLGIRVISEETGQPPRGAGAYFLRLITHIIDGIPCYIGYLWPLWDAKKQTFADKILKTVVVKG